MSRFRNWQGFTVQEDRAQTYQQEFDAMQYVPEPVENVKGGVKV